MWGTIWNAQALGLNLVGPTSYVWANTGREKTFWILMLWLRSVTWGENHFRADPDIPYQDDGRFRRTFRLSQLYTLKTSTFIIWPATMARLTGFVTWRYQVRIPVRPDLCHRGYAYTVLQTFQRHGVYTLKSFCRYIAIIVQKATQINNHSLTFTIYLYIEVSLCAVSMLDQHGRRWSSIETTQFFIDIYRWLRIVIALFC